MNVTRRRFLAVGLVGAAALGVAAWLKGPHAPSSDAARVALDSDAEALFSAVAPVLLAGMLPDEIPARRAAIADTLAGIDVAIAGLPPATRDELAQLFALLSLPPARLALARVTSPWQDATPEEVRGFLDRCRDSAWLLPRAAYDALHQLTFAAWYGNPRAWPAIGYTESSSLTGAS